MSHADAAELELVMEALGSTATRLEARARRMVEGAGRHHEERAEAMRALRAKLHSRACELAHDDTLVLDVAGLSRAQRDWIRASAAAMRNAAP